MTKFLYRLLPLLALAACAGASVAPKPRPVAHDDVTVMGSHTHTYADLPAGVVRADGSIPFTAPQPGVAPVGSADLATKGYVDSAASGASATKKVLVSSMDTTEGYLDPTLVVGSTLTKTIVNGGANETLRLDANVGTTAGTLAAGDDSRFTDGRAPTGSAGGDLTGTYPNPTLLYDRVRKDVFTTKGDILVTWGASDVRRLGVGSDGQILMALSSESPGVKWATPSAVYSHTLLSHADCYPGSAVKGSLLVGNATPLWDALPVGTDGYYLVADSAQTKGIKWAALSVPAGSVTTTSILDGTILNADIDASAAIAWSKISKSGAAASDVGAAAASHTHAASDITSGTVATARLGSGSATSSTYLRGDQTWATIPGGTNALLDGSAHTDTTASSATRGDLIVANSTPAWTRLPKGTAYQRLTMGSGATDPAWDSEPYVAISSFWRNNPTAGLTASAVPVAGGGGAVAAYFVPIYSGTIRGFSWTFSGTHSAGTITIRARKNGSASNTITLTSGTSDLSGYTTGTGATFAAGDTLGIEIDTTAGWNGTTGTLAISLWLSYDA